MALLEDTVNSRTTRRTSLSDNILAKSLKFDEDEESSETTTTTTTEAFDTETPTTITEYSSSTENTEVPETTTVTRKLIKKKRRRRVKIRIQNNTMEVYPNEMSGIPHTTPINMDSGSEEVRLFDPEVGADVDVIFAKNETETKDEKSEESAVSDEKLEEAESQTSENYVLPESTNITKSTPKPEAKLSANLKNSTESQNKNTSAAETNVKQKSSVNLEKSTQIEKKELKKETAVAKEDTQTSQKENNGNNRIAEIVQLPQAKQEPISAASNVDPLDILFKQAESEKSKIRKARQYVEQEGMFPISTPITNQQQPITSTGYQAFGNYLALYPIPDEPEETDDITPYERLLRTDQKMANESQEDIFDFAGADFPILVPEGELPLDALPEEFPDENSPLWTIDANATNSYQPIFGQYIEDSVNDDGNDHEQEDDEDDSGDRERSLPVFVPLEPLSVDDLPEEFPDFFETESEHNETLDSIVENQHKTMIENLQKMLITTHRNDNQFVDPKKQSPLPLPPQQSVQSLILDRTRYQIPPQNAHELYHQNAERSGRSFDLDEKNDILNRITVKRSENSKDISTRPFRGHIKFNSHLISTSDQLRSGKKLIEKPIMIQKNILNESDKEEASTPILDEIYESKEQQPNPNDQQNIFVSTTISESPIESTESLPDVVSESYESIQNESQTISETESPIEIQTTAKPFPQRQYESRTNSRRENQMQEMRLKRRRKILKRLKVNTTAPMSMKRSNNKQTTQINEATEQNQPLTEPSPIFYNRLNQDNLPLPTNLRGIPIGRPAGKVYTAVSSVRIPIIRRPLQPGNLHANSIASYGIISGKDISTLTDYRTRYVPMFPDGQPIHIIGPIPAPIFNDPPDHTKKIPNIVYQLPANGPPTSVINF